MLLLYANYTLVFWLLIGNSHADKHLLRKITDDQEIYGIAACTTRCMQERQQQQHQAQQQAEPAGRALHIKEQQQQSKQLLSENGTLFEQCTKHCKRESTVKTNIPMRLIQENFLLELVCRDEKSLSFRIQWVNLFSKNEQPQNETTTNATQNIIFVLKLHMTVEPKEYLVYLSDEPFFTVDGLQHNSSYNVMVVAVHDSNEYSVIAKEQTFTTLRRGYAPKMINDVKVLGYSEDKYSTKHLWANIEWRPSADKNCDYDMICFSPENDEYDALPVEIREPRELYTYSIPNLTFSSEYKIGIRAKNRNNGKESQLFWHTFRAPSCEQWFNYNFNVCAPMKPSGLSVEQTFITEDLLALNITWQKPQHMPDYYVVHVLDLRPNGSDHIINVPKDTQQVFIPEIEIKGMLFEVHLVACTPGGNSTVFVTIPTHQQIAMYVPDKGYAFKLIFVIMAPILCFVVLTLTSFIIYNRRAKLQRYQERCRYFEELEKKAPIDPKSFDFPPKTLAAPIPNAALLTPSLDNPPLITQFQRDLEEKFLQNDELEIDRNDLTLHEILGEGAFGLVRRGVYNQREVAVKMLKDQPSMDEIRAFRHEIEVMKSVEQHPNIVSLIGHCTKQQGEVMLLTEYCSLGNLQSFLREEWTFLHELRNKLKINANKLQESQKTPNANRKNKKFTKLHYFKQNLNLMQKIPAPSQNYSSQCQQNSAIKLDMQIDEITKTTTVPSLAMLVYNKTNADTPANPNESVPSPTSSTATTLSTDNKSYGYDEICTNSCKCQVDVISISDMDHHNDLATQQVANQLEKLLQQRQQEQTNDLLDEPQSIAKPKAKSITIKNCECRGKRQKQQPQPVQCNVTNKSQKGKAKGKSIANAAYFINNNSQQQLREDNNNADDKYALQLLAERQPLSAADLLDIAKQVASGMEYLGKNKVVHRDLAARNVLITSDRTIKIADFGLSRDIYQENIYKKTGNGKLPIKWLALESMTHQVYTTQSDVWSYGILLYEIVSLGGLPYPTIPANRLLHLLKSGYRMERPDNCGEELYKLMHSCWNATPTERPTFTNIIRQLDELSESAEQQISYANKLGVAATMGVVKTLPALQSGNINSSDMPAKDTTMTSNNNMEDYLQPV